MSQANRFLCRNGVVLPAADTPPVAAFLEAQPGAYTTTRSHNNVSELLFWERHLSRLSNSFKLLLRENPNLLLEKSGNHLVQFWELSNRSGTWDSVIRCLVNDSMRKVMPFAVKERNFKEELAFTVLLSGNCDNLDYWRGGFDEGRISEVLDVYLHVGGYVPPAFGARESAARLAVVGRGRDLANAKYTDWVRLRKRLEKLRPPSVTELLLSNDGEQILEGCLTNFFVVSLKEKNEDTSNVEPQNFRGIEVQTAPLSDGVLPGVIRQVIRDICLEIGIPFREVAPSWSKRELWTEAFITNSLRVLQHVETIQAPNAWKSIESNNWQEIAWAEKRFRDGPGMITSILQKEILEKASIESFPVASFEGQTFVFFITLSLLVMLIVLTRPRLTAACSFLARIALFVLFARAGRLGKALEKSVFRFSWSPSREEKLKNAGIMERERETGNLNISS
ncbi:D-aminoacid aminotransferase-like PLP-dependent enzymes superfamily protein [Perilla frutescens var. hirtella]|nr:D-aminoacid aminotransferase-like PLP-dependent enzymes superfamily protein [Perilla frutescens var. hirtella]